MNLALFLGQIVLLVRTNHSAIDNVLLLYQCVCVGVFMCARLRTRECKQILSGSPLLCVCVCVCGGGRSGFILEHSRFPWLKKKHGGCWVVLWPSHLSEGIPRRKWSDPLCYSGGPSTLLFLFLHHPLLLSLLLSLSLSLSLSL